MLTKIHADTRPYLAPGVRLFWDEVRQQPFLLFPEGTLVLNQTALAILELCDRPKGHPQSDRNHTVTEIIAELTTKYPSSNLEEDVYHFLSQIAVRGLIKIGSNKNKQVVSSE